MVLKWNQYKTNENPVMEWEKHSFAAQEEPWQCQAGPAGSVVPGSCQNIPSVPSHPATGRLIPRKFRNPGKMSVSSGLLITILNKCAFFNLYIMSDGPQDDISTTPTRDSPALTADLPVQLSTSARHRPMPCSTSSREPGTPKPSSPSDSLHGFGQHKIPFLPLSFRTLALMKPWGSAGSLFTQ